MPLEQLNGVEIYYEDSGSGFPIVLTHGFGDSAALWAANVPALVAAGYRVVTWDMLGHFRSAVPVDLGRYTQEAVVEDLRALVDHLDIRRAVFGGHSLGGYTSMRFWEKYPSYVAALIVSGTGPGYRNPEARRQWTEESLQRAVELEAHGLDAKLDARAYGLGAAPADVPVVHTARGVAWIARGVMVEPPLVDPTNFDVPVLAIVGEQDAPFLNSTDYIVNKARDATKVVIREAGHPAMFEQPDDWNAAVIEFLAAHRLN